MKANGEILNGVGSCVALLLAGASLIITYWQMPPDPTPVIELIEQEATLAREEYVDGLVALFNSDAVIRDAGRAPNPAEPDRASEVWEGAENIRGRYEVQARDADYMVLEHVDIVVVFDKSGKVARAKSSTEGVFRYKEGPATRISTVGGDEWTFVLTPDGWKIKSFSYHVR